MGVRGVETRESLDPRVATSSHLRFVHFLQY